MKNSSSLKENTLSTTLNFQYFILNLFKNTQIPIKYNRLSKAIYYS